MIDLKLLEKLEDINNKIESFNSKLEIIIGLIEPLTKIDFNINNNQQIPKNNKKRSDGIKCKCGNLLNANKITGEIYCNKCGVSS